MFTAVQENMSSVHAQTGLREFFEVHPGLGRNAMTHYTNKSYNRMQYAEAIAALKQTQLGFIEEKRSFEA